MRPSTITTVSTCLYFVGCLAAAVPDSVEVSKCYLADTVCFYTSDSDDLVLNSSDAREFCEVRNSTLPVVTDEKIYSVFQRFINNDVNSVIQRSPVWLDAHARHVDNSVNWHWINGQSSGIMILISKQLTFRFVQWRSKASGGGSVWASFDFKRKKLKLFYKNQSTIWSISLF